MLDELPEIMREPNEPPARVPVVAPLQAGLVLKIEMYLRDVSDKPNFQALGTIWENMAEDIITMLEKRFSLKEGLDAKSSAQLSSGGKSILTLSLTPHA